MMEHKITYSVKELVEATGIGKSRIYELIHDGTLPSFVFAGKRLVPAEDARRIILETPRTLPKQGTRNG